MSANILKFLEVNVLQVNFCWQYGQSFCCCFYWSLMNVWILYYIELFFFQRASFICSIAINLQCASIFFIIIFYSIRNTKKCNTLCTKHFPIYVLFKLLDAFFKGSIPPLKCYKLPSSVLPYQDCTIRLSWLRDIQIILQMTDQQKAVRNYEIYSFKNVFY